MSEQAHEMVEPEASEAAAAPAEHEPGAEGAPGAEGGEKRVPVSESIRYRRRAQAAEQELEAVREQLAEKDKSLAEAQQELAEMERRERVDHLLRESEAIDLEAARLLTEVAVAQMDKPDVEAAVAELRERKPYLFRRDAGAPVEAGMGARPRGGEAQQLSAAAEQAATTGDRRALLRYLRMRRARSR